MDNTLAAERERETLRGRRKNPIAAKVLIILSIHNVPILKRVVQILLGSDFRTIKVGNGLYLPHPYGIVVHPDVEIGSNVTLMQGITLGGAKIGSPVPMIGNNVLIGAGAVVLGGVTIGDHSTIGANAVVTKDVPEGAIVVGINQHLKPDS